MFSLVVRVVARDDIGVLAVELFHHVDEGAQIALGAVRSLGHPIHGHRVHVTIGIVIVTASVALSAEAVGVGTVVNGVP
jgi:hypothetical protein